MSQISSTSIAKVSFNQPTRPMLARDADAMYWMSRYVERAEHIARVLLVNSNVLTDVGDLTPHLQQRQWQSILAVFRLHELSAGNRPVGQQVIQYMTFGEKNPNSLVNC